MKGWEINIMRAYEFNADIKGNSIKIPKSIKSKIPEKCKVMILFEETSEHKKEKWDFAIPHKEFWAELGIASDTDLSDVEAYEIE